MFSLCFSIFQPILAWKETIKGFLIFWNFLLFFWNFLLRVGWERNGTTFFIFSFSRPFSTYFGLKWSHNGIFFNLLNFFAIFLEFSLTRQFGTKRNDNFSFLSLSLFHPILAWNEATIVFFNFFEFCSLFLEFSITSPIGRKRKDNFYFFSFSAFSNLFWHEKKP